MTMLTDRHQTLIIKALAQVPPAWRTRFADSAIDALLVIDDPSDEDVKDICEALAERMEINVKL